MERYYKNKLFISRFPFQSTTFENKSLIKYDDGRKVDKSGKTRYIKNFESSTVEYETFTYDENDVIRLDEKLHSNPINIQIKFCVG